MDLDYPQPGFHFLVVFELFPQFPNDVRFQEVTGLTVSTEFEAWPEGGENRFAHQLPKSLQFSELVLKRGKSGKYTVTVTPSGGFNDAVSFSVSGLPAGTSSSFSPLTVIGGGAVSLNVATSNPTTPRGTVTLTIMASSGSKARSVTVSLKVQ